MVKLLLTTALISVLIYFAIALGMLLSQRPGPIAGTGSLSFEGVGSVETAAPLITLPETGISYRHLPGAQPGAPLVVVVHGSGWHGGGYLALAHAIAADTGAEVLVPDLRGHGPNPQRRGDIDHLGQFEEDLAALIRHHAQPDQPVAMVGHSSGGGLVIRFASGAHGTLLDRAVLIAPFLHHAAPTARSDTGGWAHPLTRRLVGLSMLNRVGITAFNDWTVIQFNFPDTVLNGQQGDTATTAYSYRLNTSFAPRNDYLADIAKLPKFLLIAGAEDDAFLAAQYEPTMTQATDKGRYVLLPGVDHIGITQDPGAFAEITRFLSQ